MSEKEKDLIDKISKLPEKVQERFIAQAEGAAMACSVMRNEEKK